MLISDMLAYEIFIITIFHMSALIVLFSFCLYIYFHANKSPLLFSYLLLAAMIGIWLVSKILKTVAPTQELRWLFILMQYFGADFLGFFLLIFAYIYTKERVPCKKQLILWSLPSFTAILIIMTNPLHMGFYSQFDFYRDRFGVLFFPTQTVQYIFWLIGIIMLSNNYTKQPAFRSKRGFGVLFAIITLIPLFTNLYYILYKLDVFGWIFPFPVFDITPIAGTIALILFTIPAYKFRFFDILPVSYEKLFEQMPYGIIFMNKKNVLYGGNEVFYSMFGLDMKNIGLERFLQKVFNENEGKKVVAYLGNKDKDEIELTLVSGKSYRIRKNMKSKRHLLLYFADITETDKNRALLSKQNTELNDIKRRLDHMADSTKALAAAKIKSQIAQNVHDILGHSITVVIGMAELAASEENIDDARKRLSYADDLLSSSLNDLKIAIESDTAKWDKTSLISAIDHLKNESIKVDIAVHGDVYELNNAKTEALFRLCQEAVTNAIKHGKAKTVYIILRFRKKEVEVFAIDNGIGCKMIEKSFGLSGIERRIFDLQGTAEFSSDGESGFSIHAVLPK